MFRRDGWKWLLVLTFAWTLIPISALADPPPDKIVVVRHDDDDDDDDHKVVTRIVRERVYVPTRREYAHVRVTRPVRVEDGHLDRRTIVVRSARVQPYVIERFDPRSRENIDLVIRHFKEGRPNEALPLWTSFVESLPTFQQPVDLDDVMLYVARESCMRDNNAWLLQAMKVDYLDDSAERLEQFTNQLQQQLDTCNRTPGRCAADTVREIELELVRTQSDWRTLIAERDRARTDLEARSRDASDYERCVAAVYDDVFRIVETRVAYAP